MGDPHVSGRINPIIFISDPQAFQGHCSISGNRGDTAAYRNEGFCVRQQRESRPQPRTSQLEAPAAEAWAGSRMPLLPWRTPAGSKGGVKNSCLCRASFKSPAAQSTSPPIKLESLCGGGSWPIH